MTRTPDTAYTLSELTGPIFFPEGIPGFEACRQFDLEPVPDMPLFSLVCKEDENIEFIVTSPWFWIPEFEIELPDEACEGLGIHSPSQAVVLAIVTVREPLALSTMNLAAPLVLNLARREGVQMILSHPVWTTRVPVKQEGVEGSAGLG